MNVSGSSCDIFVSEVRSDRLRAVRTVSIAKPPRLLGGYDKPGRTELNTLTAHALVRTQGLCGVGVDADGQIWKDNSGPKFVAALKSVPAGVHYSEKLALLLACVTDRHGDPYGRHLTAKVPRMIGNREDDA